jgi:hypothetical protein
MWADGQISLRVVNVTRTDLDSLAFNLNLFNYFVFRLGWISVSGSLSVANTAVSSANVAVVKIGVFWDVTPCGSCKNRRFGGT